MGSQCRKKNEMLNTEEGKSSTSNNVIQIKIRTQDDRINTLRVSKHVPVNVLKDQIDLRIGIRPEQQRLICHGKVLKDDQLLSQYNAEDGHTVDLVVRNPISPPPQATVNQAETQGAPRDPTVIVGSQTHPNFSDSQLNISTRVSSRRIPTPSHNACACQLNNQSGASQVPASAGHQIRPRQVMTHSQTNGANQLRYRSSGSASQVPTSAAHQNNQREQVILLHTSGSSQLNNPSSTSQVPATAAHQTHQRQPVIPLHTSGSSQLNNPRSTSQVPASAAHQTHQRQPVIPLHTSGSSQRNNPSSTSQVPASAAHQTHQRQPMIPHSVTTLTQYLNQIANDIRVTSFTVPTLWSGFLTAETRNLVLRSTQRFLSNQTEEEFSNIPDFVGLASPRLIRQNITQTLWNSLQSLGEIFLQLSRAPTTLVMAESVVLQNEAGMNPIMNPAYTTGRGLSLGTQLNTGLPSVIYPGADMRPTRVASAPAPVDPPPPVRLGYNISGFATGPQASAHSGPGYGRPAAQVTMSHMSQNSTSVLASMRSTRNENEQGNNVPGTTNMGTSSGSNQDPSPGSKRQRRDDI